MVTEVKAPLLEKAQLDIFEMLFPIVIEVRLSHSEKAKSIIYFILLGMSIEVKLEQPLKAYGLIVVTLEGMIVFWHPTTKELDAVSMMALQLSRESYTVLSASTVMEVKLEQ